MSTTRCSRRPLARLAGGALVVLTAVALAGCSDTTEGAATAGGSSPAATTTEAAETTTEATETTTEAAPTDDGGSDGTLDCTGTDVLAPDGQPFCTAIPDGFTQTEVTTDNEAGAGAAYSTGLALSEQDVILFSVYALTADSDDLSDDELSGALAPIISQLAAQGFTFDSQQPQIEEVDNARAYVYSGSDGAGLSSDLYFIFRGGTELQLTCQWVDQQEDLLAGCDAVLDSVQVIG